LKANIVLVKILRVAWTSSVEVGLVCFCALTKHKRFVLKRMFFLITPMHKIIFIWVDVSFLPCPRLTLGQLPPSVGLNLDHNTNARVALGPLVHFHLFTKELAAQFKIDNNCSCS
jgi:hypothetical protein